MHADERRILRVFPRRTSQTPIDISDGGWPLTWCGDPGLWVKAARLNFDEVHISVVFTWDKPRAERLRNAWEEWCRVVKVGGPAYNSPCDDFIPGRYVKHGITFTTRGCPNRCWFCQVAEREGKFRELLEVAPGWIVQDNNLLAASRGHLRKVFAMLKKQPKPIHFSGGLEAARVTQWFVDQCRSIRLKFAFFAYDQPGQLGDVQMSAGMFHRAGYTREHLRCFVLMGYLGDTVEAAERRCVEAWEAGTIPFAMLYHDGKSAVRKSKGQRILGTWAWLQKIYTRPAKTKARLSEIGVLPKRGDSRRKTPYLMDTGKCFGSL